MAFLHGIEVVERQSGLKPIAAAPTSVIGLVGSAGKGPTNVPTLIAGDRTRAVSLFGDDGTIPDALEAIFAQTGASVVVVNAHAWAARDHAEANYALDGDELALPASGVSNVVVKNSGGTLTYSGGPRVQDWSEETLASGTVTVAGLAATGVSDVEVRSAASGGGTLYEAPRDYTVDLSTGAIARTAVSTAPAADATIYVRWTLPADYTLDADEGTITRAPPGRIAADATVKVAFRGGPRTGALTAAAVVGAAGQSPTGIAALASAESVVGYAPRILIAPGFSDQASVARALIGVADRLRGVAVIDGPSSTDDEARTYRAEFGARRGFLVDPGVKVADAAGDVVDRPASGYVAGLIARIDAEVGFWRSPSNHVLQGVLGTARPIGFGLSDPNSEANLLNAQSVATIVRQNGYRLWGNRSLAGADAPEWTFLSTVRIADALAINLQQNHLWAVDRGIGPTYLDEVAASVNAYINELIGLGGLIEGACRPSPDLNTAESLAGGRVYFDIDFTPPGVAERVTFRTRLVSQADLEEAS